MKKYFLVIWFIIVIPGFSYGKESVAVHCLDLPGYYDKKYVYNILIEHLNKNGQYKVVARAKVQKYFSDELKFSDFKLLEDNKQFDNIKFANIDYILTVKYSEDIFRRYIQLSLFDFNTSKLVKSVSENIGRNYFVPVNIDINRLTEIGINKMHNNAVRINYLDRYSELIYISSGLFVISVLLLSFNSINKNIKKSRLKKYQIHLNNAEMYNNKGNHEVALSELKKAEQYNINNEDIEGLFIHTTGKYKEQYKNKTNNNAKTSAIKGDVSKSKSYYEKYTKEFGYNDAIYFNSGLISYKEKDYFQAIQYFSELIKNKPDDYAARYYLGNSHIMAGNFEEGINQWSYIIENAHPEANRNEQIQKIVKEIRRKIEKIKKIRIGRKEKILGIV